MIDSPSVQRAGAYYFPFSQAPSGAINFALRTAQEPESITAAVRREVAAIDPEVPFYGVRTLQDRVDSALVDRRTPTLLASGFAAVALFLAAIGIYGVLAYQVAQRRREIGIRMALGAASPRIFRLVLSEGALIVGMGSAFGLLGAFLLRRVIETQLYQVGALDPRVLAGVGLVLVAVALVACVLPARRASKTDPVIALSDQ
jgi:ABC-type antimicrobial peptide transport system permease subunit